MQLLVIILIGTITAIIGALPFGLVNLTVLNTAYQKGKNHAMKIAHGAAWIEVLFGLIAILIGNSLIHFTNDNQFVDYFILTLPALIGFIFLFKKNSKNNLSKAKGTGFIKGAFLNLISLQVLLYWIIAISFLSNYPLHIETWFEILIFLVGIWTGKIIVLWIYSYWSDKIFTKWQFLSLNINRVIGSILLFTALLQFLK